LLAHADRAIGKRSGRLPLTQALSISVAGDDARIDLFAQTRNRRGRRGSLSKCRRRAKLIEATEAATARLS
jgi:hypothetical protein